MALDHADRMDQVYRRQRYIYDFTRKYYLFGRDRLIRRLALKPGDSVVEIGCGTARNLVKMARRYPQARIYGLDASHEMLKSAERSIRRAGLADRISLAHGFAENLTPCLFGRADPFTHAIFSYSLSMIPDWKQSLKSASLAVGGTGEVWVVDFGDLHCLGPLAARALTMWLRLFHVTPRMEIIRKIQTQQLFAEQESDLDILPAHYAFVWRGRGKAAESLAL